MPKPLQNKNEDILNNANILAKPNDTGHKLLTVRIQNDVRRMLKEHAFSEDKKQWEIIDAALRAYLKKD